MSSTINLHLKPSSSSSSPPTSTSLSQPPSSLPSLIQTPTGLAILELQGTFNVPDDPSSSQSTSSAAGAGGAVDIGTISFPDYHGPDDITKSTAVAWMKRVYMHVGAHQRLAGEVKKLPRPLAVVRRRRRGGGTGGEEEEEEEEEEEDLEVVEVVRYKIVFSQRPEPVTTGDDGEEEEIKEEEKKGKGGEEV